jgi:hypothetical protein
LILSIPLAAISRTICQKNFKKPVAGFYLALPQFFNKNQGKRRFVLGQRVLYLPYTKFFQSSISEPPLLKSSCNDRRKSRVR